MFQLLYVSTATKLFQTNTLCHTLPGFTTFLGTPLDSKHFINDPTLSYQFFYVFKHANFDSSFSLQNKS